MNPVHLYNKIAPLLRSHAHAVCACAERRTSLLARREARSRVFSSVRAMDQFFNLALLGTTWIVPPSHHIYTHTHSG
jgi:hypothetical protein